MYCCSHSGSSTTLPKKSAVGDRQRQRADQEVAPREQAQVDDRVLARSAPRRGRTRSRPRRRPRARRSGVESNQSSSLPLSSMICSAPTQTTSSAEADVVDRQLARRGLALAVDRPGERRGDQADRDVDVEDPRPRDVVGDPAAEQRPGDRRDQRRHRPHRHRRARPWRADSSTAAASATAGSSARRPKPCSTRKAISIADVGRQAAQPRRDRRTAAIAADEQPHLAEALREPAGERHRDRVGDARTR